MSPLSYRSPGLALGRAGIDLFLTLIALLIADLGRRVVPFGMPISADAVYLTPLIYTLVAAVWPLVFFAWGAYDPRSLLDERDEARAVTLSIVFSVFTLTSLFYFLKVEDFSRVLFGYFILLDAVLVIAGRVALRAMLGRLRVQGYDRRRVLIVGHGEDARRLAGELLGRQVFDLIGVAGGKGPLDLGVTQLPCLGSLDDVAYLVRRHGVHEVLITQMGALTRDAMARLVMALRHEPVRIRIVPDLLQLITAGSYVFSVQGVPLINIHEPAIRGMNSWVKRVLDVAGSALALALASPVMLLTAILIRLDSQGPAIFVQYRSGLGGRPFRLYKFRTMRADAEQQLGKLIDLESLPEPVFKIRRDPRVTRAGRWLRRFSIDELPQLVNVLKGEMSLVGPRPEEVRLVDRYTPWQRQRLLVKPGLTGSMQVNGRGDLSLEDRVKLELSYIENYSLWQDLYILMRTLPVVVLGRGSY